MNEIADGKSLQFISNPGWEGMFNINDYEDEIKLLHRIIDLLISPNIEITSHPDRFSMTSGPPKLKFGIWDIVLEDANNDMSLKEVREMFKIRMHELLEGKE